MIMNKDSLYFLGVKAKAGDELALMDIINRKKNLIKYYSRGDEDREQYIIETLIRRIKNYNF